MKKIVLIAAVLLGCGPGFSGTYTGTMSGIFACPSGTDGSGEASATWTLSQTGKDVTIQAEGGTCNPISALVGTDADSATISSKTCPPVPDQFGGVVTESYIDGSLTLDNSGDLTVLARGLARFHDPGYPDETCPEAFFGTLARQK